MNSCSGWKSSTSERRRAILEDEGVDVLKAGIGMKAGAGLAISNEDPAQGRRFSSGVEESSIDFERWETEGLPIDDWDEEDKVPEAISKEIGPVNWCCVAEGIGNITESIADTEADGAFDLTRSVGGDDGRDITAEWRVFVWALRMFAGVSSCGEAAILTLDGGGDADRERLTNGGVRCLGGRAGVTLAGDGDEDMGVKLIEICVGLGSEPLAGVWTGDGEGEGGDEEDEGGCGEKLVSDGMVDFIDGDEVYEEDLNAEAEWWKSSMTCTASRKKPSDESHLRTLTDTRSVLLPRGGADFLLDVRLRLTNNSSDGKVDKASLTVLPSPGIKNGTSVRTRPLAAITIYSNRITTVE